jgi:hypothetical protein
MTVVDPERAAQRFLERWQIAGQQFISGRRVVRRLWPVDAVVRILCHAETEVVRLHALVRSADRVRRPRHDFGQQHAGGIDR